MCTQKALRVVAALFAAVALLLAPAGSAEAGDRNWRMRVIGAVVGGDGIGFDPLIFSFGFGFKF